MKPAFAVPWLLVALTARADTPELPQGFILVTPQERAIVVERLEAQGKEIERLQKQVDSLKAKQGCA